MLYHIFTNTNIVSTITNKVSSFKRLFTSGFASVLSISILLTSLTLVNPVSVLAANPTACTAGGTVNNDHNGDPLCAGKVQYRAIYDSIDCATNEVIISVQVKSNSAFPQPVMGDYNIRLAYNSTVLQRIGTGLESLFEQTKYSNQAPASNTAYNAQNLNGSVQNTTTGVISINGFFGSNSIGEVIPTTFTTVSKLKMTVINPAVPIAIAVNDASEFPITGNNVVLDDGVGGYDLISPAYEPINPDLVGSSQNTLCTGPSATDDNYTATGTTPITLSPLTGDTPGTTIKSINGTDLAPGTAQVISATNGTVNIDTAGIIKFIATTGFIGTTTIPYIIQNSTGQTAAANQIIVVSSTSLLSCNVMYGSFNNGSGLYTRISEISPTGVIGPLLGTLSGTTAASGIDPISKKYFYATSTGPSNVLNFFDPVTGNNTTGLGVVSVNNGPSFIPIKILPPLGTTTKNTTKGAVRMAINKNGVGYVGGIGGQLYTFSTTAPYTPSVAPSITNNPNNYISVNDTIGGDFAFDDAGNLYQLSFTIDEVIAGAITKSTPMLYKITGLPTAPVATLLGQAGPQVTGDPIPQAASMAFHSDGFLYINTSSGIFSKINPGDLTQTAIITNPIGSLDMASCQYPILNTGLESTKTVTNISGGTTANSGNILEYTIKLKNIGNLVATEAKLLESIPANTTYIANSTTLNNTAVADITGAMPFVTAGLVNTLGQFSGLLIQDTTPTIDDNEAIVKFRVTVNNPVPTGTTNISNQATLSAKDSTSVQSDDPTKPGVNDPTTIPTTNIVLPTATNDNYTTTGTTPVTLTPLTGDTTGTIIKSINGVDLIPGTAQTISVTNGTINISATGLITFTANVGYTGLAEFAYIIQNASGQTATANENINISPATNLICINKILNGGYTSDLSNWTATAGWIYNNGTAALATDSLTNQTISQSITGYSVSGGNVTFKIELQPAEANNLTTFDANLDISFGGTKYLTISNPIGTGDVTYTTANGSIYAVDTVVRNQFATIYLTVPNTGTAPKTLEFKHVSGDDDWYIYNVATDVCVAPITATSDDITVSGTTPVVINPLVNDTPGTTIQSINGTALTPGIAQTITIPGKGVVNISANNVISFVANPGYVGVATFPYNITDPSGQSANANVNITVGAAVVPTSGGAITINQTNKTADLKVNKQGSKVKTGVGESLTYTIEVTNIGPDDSNGGSLTDNLPAGYSPTSFNCVASGGAICPTNLSASSFDSGILFNLNNGGKLVFTIEGIVNTAAQLVNTAKVNLPTGITDPNPGDNESTFPTVFDPPSGKKIGTYKGRNIVEWKQVWINEFGKAPVNATISDDIPAGTEYVPGTLQCFARGVSITTSCTFDSIRNTTTWIGNIGADFGNTTEDTAANEVVVTFQILLPAEMTEVENQSKITTDRGDTRKSDNPVTNEKADITKVIRISEADAILQSNIAINTDKSNIEINKAQEIFTSDEKTINTVRTGGSPSTSFTLLVVVVMTLLLISTLRKGSEE